MQVLILTHNILVEKSLEDRLQQLNIEVLISVKLLTMLKDKKPPLDFLSFFDVLIVSENVFDQELRIILKGIGDKFTIIREVESVPTKEESNDWKSQGINDWLLRDEMLSGIREKLAENTLKKSAHSIELDMKSKEENDYGKHVIPLWELTGAERDMLKLLISTRNAPISRKDLAFKIWGNGVSASHQARLSTIINHLRRKLKIADSDSDIIHTTWGVGYQLSKAFFNYYNIERYATKETGAGV